MSVYDEGFQRTYFEAQNHWVKGDLDLAYTSFLACLDMEPEEQALHFDLAKIDLAKERYDAAKLHLDAVISHDAEHRWAREYRAEAALALGDFDTAQEDLEWIVQARPGDIDWAFDWTLRLADAGDVEGALALCDVYDALTPGDPDILLQRLYFFELLNDYEAIYKGLEQAVVDFPDIPEFQIQWAQMLRATGQTEDALGALLSVVADDPSNGLAQLDLAHLYTELNEVDKAQDALSIAFASEDVYVEEKQEILIQYLQIARVEPALNGAIATLLEAALGQHPASADLLMLATDFEQGRGNPEGARAYGLKAVEAHPGNPMCWGNLIALDAELGAIDEMEQHAQQAMDLFPLEADFAYYAAMAALDVQAFERVVGYLQRGLAVVLDAPEMEAMMQGMLGDALHAIGRADDAYPAYERSLALYPDNPLVLNNYAYHLAEAEVNLPRALECSSLLMELAPMDANFMDTHAWVLYKNGQFAEALDFITQALFQSENQGATFWEHDGDIRLAMGDAAGAVASWTRALETGGEADRLQKKINGIP
jgi:tetratricopeptide (TPR) repeat protein